MRNTPTSTPTSAASIEAAVRRRQNLQIVGTFAGLVALVSLLNCTPLPLMVCEQFGLDRDVPANLLGEAYWDDCFGGPLGNFTAGPLPRPDDLSYAPEADTFLATPGEFADTEAAQQEATPEGEGSSEGSDNASEDPAL